MRRSGDHLLGLIEEVIDFARLEADRMPLASEPVDLELLVRDVVELLRPAASSASLELVAEVEPGMPRWVLGDQRRLRQVLMNLAGNAVKFTLRGSVRVTVGCAGGRHVFTVRDTGVGIDGAMLERLFQPFEQAEAEANRRFGGSGLGLAVTRRLVERMGGTLSVESQLGVGSTFTVAIPLTPTDARPASPELAAVAPAPGAARRLLVVDDNELNLHVATALVRRLGHEATAYRSGQEAIDALQAGTFDAVLMDCHMPGLDGFETTQRIRQLRAPLSHIPIIALTASALPEELARCVKSGMNDCLTKPVTLDALKAAIDRVMRAPPQAPSAGPGDGQA
jgi:CheY-like chemotaxis protein